MGVRKALNVEAHDEAPPADPNSPHEYRAAGENWVGGGVPPAALGGLGGNAAAITGAGMSFADRHCVICRREETDPIHAPAEE